MSLETQHILLIEEEPVVREITAFRLELLGYKVTACDSSKAGIVAIEENLPNLIIIDQYLTGIEGLELVNRFSNDVRTAEIPILILSTNTDLTDVQRAYRAGAKEYLLIPFDPLLLEDKIQKLLNPSVAV